ncbi:hypothetical protein [Microbacterium sp. CFBP 8794]|uniref:hypothetical protein n=1 Tax=Microbacterium sp. CFBP 8794 TaxID=2775269 RepID=UPI0017825309|nr:hypothetical protein [Microbacterium sp. CFBP 8794]MBD8478379.1 hypothetical protein [Microbacterium sp. CFBP 8794]
MTDDRSRDPRAKGINRQGKSVEHGVPAGDGRGGGTSQWARAAAARRSSVPVFAQAIAAQARGAVADMTLLGVTVSALLLSLSLAAGVPSDLGTASAAEKELAVVPLSAVVAVYAAVMATIYGSFRYTIDLRVGVVAQRATLQPRGAAIAARVPFTALGGAVVAGLALAGGRVALAPVLGTTGLGPGVVAGTLVVGAVAALWGLGVGLLVRAHLFALFVAPLSLSVALFVGAMWPEPAGWMPLPAMLHAVGFDLASLGIVPAASGHILEPAVSTAITATWTSATLGAGIVSFLRRDLA